MNTERLRRLAGSILLPFRTAPHIQHLLRTPATITREAAAVLVRTVNLIIEPRCTLACQHCHYRHSHEAPAPAARYTIKDMLQLLDDVPSANVAITGGEPLLSPVKAVETAKTLLHRRRETSLLTSGLPIHGSEGSLVRKALETFSPDERRRLRMRCSIDRMHQRGSGLTPEEYASQCHRAIQYLKRSGFVVLTRSVVTDPDDYAFYREHVLPLERSKVTSEASMQPDMYNLNVFAQSIRQGELPGVVRRVDPRYVRHVMQEVKSRPHEPRVPTRQPLRATPWALIEINHLGVRGPSAFLPATMHHPSVLDMLRSYNWMDIANAIVPQLTISRNAFPYRVDARDRSVTVNLPHLFARAFYRA